MGGNPSWTVPSASAISITDTNTNATYYPTFVLNGGAGQTLRADIATNPLSYNPSTGTLTATSFSGAATTVDITATNTIGTFYPTFVSSTGTGQILRADPTTTALTWQPSIGALTTPIIVPNTIRDTVASSGSTGQILSVTTGNAILWVNPLSITNLTAMISLGGNVPTQSSITCNIAGAAVVNPIELILTGSTQQNFPATSGFSLDTGTKHFRCTISGSYIVSLTIPITTTVTTYDTYTDFRYNGNTTSGGFVYARCRATRTQLTGDVISLRFNWSFNAGDYFDFAITNVAAGPSNCSMFNGASISTTRIE